MRNIYFILSTLILIGLSSCTSSNSNAVRSSFNPAPRAVYGPEDFERWKTTIESDTTSALYTLESIDENGFPMMPPLPYDEKDSYWLPSQSDIAKFELLLSNKLLNSKSAHPIDPPGPLWQYAMQYIGYIKNGKRFIYAQGLFCLKDCYVSKFWYYVLDGGTSAFTATFNVETGELKSFGFNGNA